MLNDNLVMTKVNWIIQVLVDPDMKSIYLTFESILSNYKNGLHNMID